MLESSFVASMSHFFPEKRLSILKKADATWPIGCNAVTPMQAAVWIDQDNAKVFEFEGTAVQVRSLKHQQSELRKFFQEVANALRTANEVLIVGPGLAKHHLSTHLSEHYPLVFNKVVGCETVETPTENQIRAFAQNFFRSHKK